MHTHILTEGDNDGYNLLWIYINFHLICYCIDFWLCSLLIITYILFYVNMYDNTYHMSLHKEFNIMWSWFFFLCVFFAWLADRIWNISGRETDSLINMAFNMIMIMVECNSESQMNTHLHIINICLYVCHGGVIRVL